MKGLVIFMSTLCLVFGVNMPESIVSDTDIIGDAALNSGKIVCDPGFVEIGNTCIKCKNINGSCASSRECCGVPHMACWKFSDKSQKCDCLVNVPYHQFNIKTDDGRPICIYTEQSDFLLYAGIVSGVLGFGGIGMLAFAFIRR